MSAPSVSTEEILERLSVLWHKLEDEGLYVRANTVSLAIDEIKRLSPSHSVEPCGLADPSYHDCPNMKEVGGGFEGERFRCAVCGKSYFLDYDDMK